MITQAISYHVSLQCVSIGQFFRIVESSAWTVGVNLAEAKVKNLASFLQRSHIKILQKVYVQFPVFKFLERLCLIKRSYVLS